MRVSVVRTGDITGRRVGGTVDTSVLPGDQQALVQALLEDDDRLRRAARTQPPAGAADIPTYEVAVQTSVGTTHRYEISQACGDSTLVGAIETVLQAT